MRKIKRVVLLFIIYTFSVCLVSGAELHGFVYNKALIPVNCAKVYVNGKKVITDEKGQYKVKVKKGKINIVVEKKEYQVAKESFYLTGEKGRCNIILYEKNNPTDNTIKISEFTDIYSRPVITKKRGFISPDGYAGNIQLPTTETSGKEKCQLGAFYARKDDITTNKDIFSLGVSYGLTENVDIGILSKSTTSIFKNSNPQAKTNFSLKYRVKKFFKNTDFAIATSMEEDAIKVYGIMDYDRKNYSLNLVLEKDSQTSEHNVGVGLKIYLPQIAELKNLMDNTLLIEAKQKQDRFDLISIGLNLFTEGNMNFKIYTLKDRSNDTLTTGVGSSVIF